MSKQSALAQLAVCDAAILDSRSSLEIIQYAVRGRLQALAALRGVR
jgi:hypothetical protein